MLKSALLQVAVVSGLVACSAFAQEMTITSFDADGSLTWTNTVPGEEYGVYWASSLNGPWYGSWDTPGLIVATNSTATTHVPLFYRAVRWPTAGLVAYYPFTLGPNDVSTNGFSAVATAVTQVLDRTGMGLAYSFDGSNSYIDCGDHPAVDGTNGVTLSGWVKTAATNFQSIGGKFAGSGGYYLRVQSDRVEFEINNSGWANANITPITNEWFFVAATWKSMETRTYVNGVQVGSAGVPFSMNPPTLPFTIGCRFFSGTPSWPFKGLIDDVRVFNRALSSNEVWALYQYPR